MSWTRSMSVMSSTFSDCSKSSSTRTATVAAAASANGIRASSPGMSRAFAIRLFNSIRGSAREVLEQHPLPQSAAGHGERQSAKYGRGRPQEDEPRRQQADALAGEREA